MADPQPTEKSVFLAAIEIGPATERAAFVDRACAGNPGLCAAVEALLLAHEQLLRLLDATAAAAPTLDEPPPERPGKAVGPYKLLEAIGEGGMGTVWLAQQTEPVRR